MPKKTYTPEQIISKLRKAEILLNQGVTIAEASRKIGVTEQTYYRWRKEYGGMRIEQVRLLASGSLYSLCAVDGRNHIIALFKKIVF